MLLATESATSSLLIYAGHIIRPRTALVVHDERDLGPSSPHAPDYVCTQRRLKNRRGQTPRVVS